MESSTTTVRCVLYLRVSLDATGEQLAVSRQRKDCTKIAAERGWQVIREYVDNSIGAWSKTRARPEYNRMVEDYEAGQFDALVCWDLDRLTRQPRQLEDWIDAAEDKGLLLVTVDRDTDLTSDNGILFAGIKANVARAESGRKAARQRAALKQRAESGRTPLGVRLTGYTTAGEIVDEEAEFVRAVFRRFWEGDTLRGICAWLAGLGAVTRRGGPWSPSSIRTILANPRYAGRCYYNRKKNKLTGPWVPGSWEPLVADEVFDGVQDMLADPRRRTHSGTSRRHLGSGLYLCGVCDKPVRAHTSVPAGGTSQLRYRCPAGGHITRSAGPVDELVMVAVTDALADPDSRAAFEPETGEARRAAESVKRLRIQLRKADLDYDKGYIDGERYKARKDRITADLDAAEATRAGTAAGAALASMMAGWDPGPDAVRAKLAALPIGGLRAVVDELMTVRLARAPRGKHFDPATVLIEWKAGQR